MPRSTTFLATLGALGALALVAGGAAADTRAKQPRPRLTAEITAAIASGDAARRCQAAITLGQAGDHVRAGLLVGACSDPALADDVALAAQARATRIAVSKAATAGDWSKVELVIKTTGATAVIDAYPEVPLTSGAWRLPPGTYQVTSTTPAGVASSELVLHDGIRSLIVLAPPPAAAAVRHQTVDFTSGEPMAAPVAGPPKIEHGSLLPERYRKGLAAKRPRK